MELQEEFQLLSAETARVSPMATVPAVAFLFGFLRKGETKRSSKAVCHTRANHLRVWLSGGTICQ